MSNKKRSKEEQVDEKDKTKKFKMKNKKKHEKLKKVLKIIFIIFFILCIIGAGILAGIFFGLFGDDFKIEKDDLLISKMNSVIKDIDGNVIEHLSGEENRKIITKADMPQYLPDAFVSIEDERFYSHHGVDIKRTGAATVTYIFNRGSSSFGGSTITQQLVKNLTNEKDDSGVKGIIRKVKEMSKAYQVEKLISKDQILELYLNLIYLGGGGKNVCGVEVAAQYYFSKSAKDLDLAECAFIAGINHSPNAYKPFKTDDSQMQEKIKKRTKTVLIKMKELGKINDEEYNTAMTEVDNGLGFKEGNVTTGSTYSYHTAAAITQIRNQLMEEKGWSKDLAEFNIYNQGYTIYTTQDTEIQTRMEKEFKEKKYIVKSKKNADAHSQAAMVIINHTNGQVVGTVGGLGDDVNAQGWNRATQHLKQTGSSMKPISVIAPALEKGIITAGTVYDDCKTSFDNGKYNPKNYYNGYKGLSTVRDAIEISQNIIPIKILTELEPKNSIEFMKKMGITSLDDKKDQTLSIALGGLTNGASPLEMAAAYATIANDGEYITPTFYTKVEDRNGKVLVEAKQEKRRIMSVQNAYIEKSILTQPVKGAAGTATYCAIPGIDVAAKTGTTNDNFDRWLCGFTPYYTAATWFGYDDNEEVKYSGNPAGKIWDAIMTDIHKGLEKKTFSKPDGIVTATICKDTGLLATDKCSRTYSEVFVKGTEPKEKCNGQVTVNICKETGKIANEYCKDVEEKSYTIKPSKEEKGKWKSEYGDKFTTPPTETCTVHTKVEELPPENTTPPQENNTNTTNENTTENGNTVTNENNTTGGEIEKPIEGENTTGGDITEKPEEGNKTPEG